MVAVRIISANRKEEPAKLSSIRIQDVTPARGRNCYAFRNRVARESLAQYVRDSEKQENALSTCTKHNFKHVIWAKALLIFA